VRCTAFVVCTCRVLCCKVRATEQRPCVFLLMCHGPESAFGLHHPLGFVQGEGGKQRTTGRAQARIKKGERRGGEGEEARWSEGGERKYNRENRTVQLDEKQKKSNSGCSVVKWEEEALGAFKR